jgi:hypothetical protein
MAERKQVFFSFGIGLVSFLSAAVRRRAISRGPSITNHVKAIRRIHLPPLRPHFLPLTSADAVADGPLLDLDASNIRGAPRAMSFGHTPVYAVANLFKYFRNYIYIKPAGCGWLTP